jgi:hypothetical protein
MTQSELNQCSKASPQSASFGSQTPAYMNETPCRIAMIYGDLRIAGFPTSSLGPYATKMDRSLLLAFRHGKAARCSPRHAAQGIEAASVKCSLCKTALSI